MKRIILTLLVAFVATAAFSQNKWQQKKIDYFVDAGTAEFKLDTKQTKELSKTRTAYFLEYMEIINKEKAGDITEDEKKTQVNAHNQKFNNDLKEITGKENDEIQPFLKRMRDELKDVK
jgi:uncharacterized protein YjbJ (UPF0337 family)